MANKLLRCDVCGNEYEKQSFSKTQLKKGAARRCRKCIEKNRPKSTKNKPEVTNLNKPKSSMATIWVTDEPKAFKSVYSVGQQIGESSGEISKTYRCKRKKDKKIFAVKYKSKSRLYELNISSQRRNAFLIQLQGEIDIMRRLKHKYIINMEEHYEDKNTLYIVMNECEGGELFHRIREKQRYKEEDASPVIKMILEALFYLHEYHHVVHCNLTPSNILFVDKNDNDNSSIQLLDFGHSKVLPRLRSLRELCGTPYYTAPEIIKGDYSHSCDMWSLGVIMFVMLYGFPPFYVDQTKFFGHREAQAIYTLIQRGFTPRVKRGYGPWFPRKMPISEDSRDLMARLMETDTSKRLSAKEALQHQWILNGGKTIESKNIDNKINLLIFGYCRHKNLNEIPIEISKMIIYFYNNIDQILITKELIYQFANFTTGHQFKHVITLLFRDKFEKIRPHIFDNLKGLFKRLDIKDNGMICFQEFKIGIIASKHVNLKEENIKQIFDELDFKKTGQIDFHCLVKAAIYDYLIGSDQRLYEAFRELDDDEDGKLNISQLIKKNLNIKHMDKIIHSVDLDKDGYIDYEEFLRALHPDFNQTPKWFWSAQTDFDENK